MPWKYSKNMRCCARILVCEKVFHKQMDGISTASTLSKTKLSEKRKSKREQNSFCNNSGKYSSTVTSFASALPFTFYFTTKIYFYCQTLFCETCEKETNKSDHLLSFYYAAR